MGREIDPGLEALMETNAWKPHSTMDIVLASGAELHLSTIEKTVIVDGEPREYQAQLRDVGALSMGLTLEMDGMEFGVQNVDMVVGRTLTGGVRQLDGAKAMKGQLFINRDDPSEYYYDPQVPGELVAGDVTDEKVSFSFISEIDAVVVSGRLISDEFQMVQPSRSPTPERPTVPVVPLQPPGPGGGGRYEVPEPIDLPYVPPGPAV